MDKDILTLFFFLIFLGILSFVVEKKKSRNWVNWVGVVLTSLVGGGFTADLLSGTLSPEGDYLIAGFSMIVVGVYLIYKKPKIKTKKEKIK